MLRRSVVASKAASNSLIEALPEENGAGYSSVVIEYIVPKHKSWPFRRWNTRLIRSAKRSDGFIRADRHRPLNCRDGALKWYSVIHFDQPENLNKWLTCEQREAALKQGRNIFESYKFKSFSTGLEGWFSKQSGMELGSLGPPAWKQILAVVLGLYPIIMLQDYLFSYLGILEDWPPASAMWANIMITSCILTFVVMPLIVKLLDFWLQPAHQVTSTRAEVVGTVSTLVAMGLMVLAFSAIA
ncbi:MAG: hypothetical protein WA885_15985 [Phormidesmis sp.]